MPLTNKRVERPTITEYPTYVSVSAYACSDEEPQGRLFVLDIEKSDLDATNDRDHYLRGRLYGRAKGEWAAAEKALEFRAAASKPYQDDLATRFPHASRLDYDEAEPTNLAAPAPITLPEPPPPEPVVDHNAELAAAIGTARTAWQAATTVAELRAAGVKLFDALEGKSRPGAVAGRPV